MLALLLLLALIAPAFSQKKPITLAALADYEQAAGKQDGPPIWAPDGKSFVFERGKTIMLYQPESRASREVLSIEPLEKAAVPASKDGPFAWPNRRVAADAGTQWSPSGKELL